jgi:hypothetical protein
MAAPLVVPAAPRLRRQKSHKGTISRPSVSENLVGVCKIIHRHIVSLDGPGMYCYLVFML